MTTGIYVHVPFCRSRCAYCDFFSTIREEMAASYVEALCREITARRHELPHAHVRTIYFGGGTPSLLSPALLRQVLETIYEHYDVDAEAEVTLEMNPDDWPFTVSPCKDEEVSAARDDSDLTALLHQGTAGKGRFNRVSLGIQSFDDALLRLVRRRHDAATAIQVVRALQHEGIDNISIDLIYGLPGQTMAQWEHDLDTTFSLGVQHLSAYALSYESGTLLTRWRDEGLVREVTDEQSVKMYERLCQRAREAGFEHYEISNFARPGFHSRHNSSYWTGAPYLGFGPGAHSYDGLRTRRANRPTLDEYISYWSSPFAGGLDDDLSTKLCEETVPVVTVERLTDDELYDEAVMCGLRTSRGIRLEDISKRFGPDRLSYLRRMAEPHLRTGHLVEEDGHLRLSESAIMISDDIMSDLMAIDT